MSRQISKETRAKISVGVKAAWAKRKDPSNRHAAIMAGGFIKGSGMKEPPLVRVKRKNSEVYMSLGHDLKDSGKDSEGQDEKEQVDSGLTVRRSPEIRYTVGERNVGSK